MKEVDEQSNYGRPESFQRLENFAHALLAVPKEEADAVEEKNRFRLCTFQDA